MRGIAASVRQDPDPIFIIGLPRSGSTLLEQILASHSQVEGTQELAFIQQIVAKLRGREPDLDNPRYPQRAELRCEPKSLRSSARQYLADAAGLSPRKALFYRQNAQ